MTQIKRIFTDQICFYPSDPCHLCSNNSSAGKICLTIKWNTDDAD